MFTEVGGGGAYITEDYVFNIYKNSYPDGTHTKEDLAKEVAKLFKTQRETRYNTGSKKIERVIVNIKRIK